MYQGRADEMEEGQKSATAFATLLFQNAKIYHIYIKNFMNMIDVKEIDVLSLMLIKRELFSK